MLKTPSVRLGTRASDYAATARPITDPAEIDDVVEALRHRYGEAAIDSYYPKRGAAVQVTLV